jgi:Uma2 family endonuclease
MSTLNTRTGAATPATEADDPFRYGWRYVQQVGPDGKEQFVQVPLSEEDVLHPQEDDFIVQNAAHYFDCRYLDHVLRVMTRSRPDVVLLHDCRTDWEAEGIKPHGPDFVVMTGVEKEWDPRKGTFYPKAVDARVVLVIEVTSPTTRKNDLGVKVAEYHQASIPLYVIVDREADPAKGEPRLIRYRYAPEGYVQELPDEMGRLWVEPIGVWLAWEGDRLIALDERGNPIPDSPELAQIATDAEKRASEEAKARKDAEQRAADEEKARKDAEQRAADAKQQAANEAKARKDAEQRAADEEKARKDAERARQDSERRADDLALRMQEMEAELRRLRGEE